MNAVATYQPEHSKQEAAISAKALTPFLILTFALTWGTAALAMLFPDQIAAVFGEFNLSNPIVILAIYSHGIAGVIIALRYYGLKGLGRFFQRLTLWRLPLSWWGFLLLGIPAVVFAGAAIKGSLNTAFAFSPWYLALPALGHALLLGPIEEFGWRGLALPLLQRRFSPFWAGLILGGIWALWHVPSFLISGMPQSSWSVGPYFLGIIAISVILTPLFNASRGSLLIATLYHFQMMNPLWPDAQPYNNLLFVAAANFIVILNRKEMFRRGSGVTDILMPAQPALPNTAELPAEHIAPPTSRF
jgi:membrane protease YdiL (CAAX protease family)